MESAAKSPSPSQQAIPRDATPTDEPSHRAAVNRPFLPAAEAVLEVSRIAEDKSPDYSTPVGMSLLYVRIPSSIVAVEG